MIKGKEKLKKSKLLFVFFSVWVYDCVLEILQKIIHSQLFTQHNVIVEREGKSGNNQGHWCVRGTSVTICICVKLCATVLLRIGDTKKRVPSLTSC